MAHRFVGKYAAEKRKNATAQADAKARHAAWLASLTPAEQREYRSLCTSIDSNNAWRCAAIEQLGTSISRDEYNSRVAEGIELEAKLAAFRTAHR